MGDHITGIKKLNEISGTVKGANEHCTRLFQKSFGGEPSKPGVDQPDPAPKEESEMDAKITKSFAALMGRSDPATSNQVFAYVGGLAEDKVKAFFEQDEAAQDAEVKKALEDAAAAKAKADEDAKRKAAGDPEVAALREKVASLEARDVANVAKARDGELKEIAKSKYPGVPTAYDTLKSIDGLTEEQQAPILKTLAAQQELTRGLKKSFGADEPAEGSAVAKHAAVVAEVAKEKGVSKSEATVLVADNPEHAQLVADMRAEMREDAAAA